MWLHNVEDRHARLEQWHRKFAWMPVMLENGDVVWGQFVERRLEGGAAKYDEDGLIPLFEYRRRTK